MVRILWLVLVSTTPASVFFFFGAGGGGEGGGGGEEKRFFFFLERFLEGHICSSRCKLPEGRYGVDLNLR